MPVDDAYTVSLLHMDGADASTTFTDESGKTVTANGNAQIDTAQSVFGGASGLFDGTGDYLTIPDSADWSAGSGDFFIDGRFRFSSGTQHGIFEQSVDANNFQIWYAEPNVLVYTCYLAGAYVMRVTAPFTISSNTWYHLALGRSGSTVYMFVDGVSQTVTVTHGSASGTIPDFGAEMKLGYCSIVAYYLNGWIDEFRWSKGIARWTANFTPPSAAYAPMSSNFFF